MKGKSKFDEEFLEKLMDKIDIVEYLSNYLELKEDGNRYRACCPFHKEATPSFTVFPDTKRWYCFGCHLSGSIIGFTARYLNIHFDEAVERLINSEGVAYKATPEIIKNMKMAVPKPIKEKIERVILAPNVMDTYRDSPIIEWEEEGISRATLKKYQVRYDDEANRIVFPVWDANGNIISIKGRTLYPNYKELGMAKYKHYYKIGENDFFYPQHLTFQSIKEKGEVILFESEKSVWKAEDAGIYNSWAIGSSNLSPSQIKILFQLGATVVYALDNGLEWNLMKKEIQRASIFLNTYAMFDSAGLLGEKDSPIDKGVNIFWELYNNKKRVKAKNG